MKYIHGTTDFKMNNTCVTIGKFDGLHMGHQMLIGELKKYEAHGLTSVMLTFDMAPSEVLHGEKEKQLYSEEERVRLLEKKGPQVLISYPFTRETAATEPYDFLKEVLIGKLGACVIVIGDDFRFGKDRKGDAAFLIAHEREFDYTTVVCPRLAINENIVSSSFIRDKLVAGESQTAEIMLNRAFFD